MQVSFWTEAWRKRESKGERELFEENRSLVLFKHVYLEDRVKETLRVGAARTFFTSLVLYISFDNCQNFRRTNSDRHLIWSLSDPHFLIIIRDICLHFLYLFLKSDQSIWSSQHDLYNKICLEAKFYLFFRIFLLYIFFSYVQYMFIVSQKRWCIWSFLPIYIVIWFIDFVNGSIYFFFQVFFFWDFHLSKDIFYLVTSLFLLKYIYIYI